MIGDEGCTTTDKNSDEISTQLCILNILKQEGLLNECVYKRTLNKILKGNLL